jgi:hypothetical protein
MLHAAAAGLFGMLGIHFKANIGIRQRMWASAAKKLLKNQIDPSFDLTEFVDGAKFAYKIVRQVIGPACFARSACMPIPIGTDASTLTRHQVVVVRKQGHGQLKS